MNTNFVRKLRTQNEQENNNQVTPNRESNDT